MTEIVVLHCFLGLYCTLFVSNRKTWANALLCLGGPLNVLYTHQDESRVDRGSTINLLLKGLHIPKAVADIHAYLLNSSVPETDSKMVSTVTVISFEIPTSPDQYLKCRNLCACQESE